MESGKAWKNDERAERQGAREAECADGSEEIRETECAEGTREGTGRPGNINRKSAAVGVLCALVCRLLFGEEQFILPAMICIMVILVAGRRMFEGADGDKVRKEVDQNAG